MTLPRWMHVVAAVGVAGVALAACGSSKSSTATAPTSIAAATTTGPASTSGTSGTSTTATAAAGKFDSCSKVAQAQAASALGQSVSTGVLGSATVEGGLACVFYGPATPTPTNPSVAQNDSVRVVVVKGADAATWYNDYKSKVRPQAISGLGDEAYYDGSASLSVLKGDTYLRIAVSPQGAPPSLAAEQQLATAILPNL